jgi:HEAT repeat protein
MKSIGITCLLMFFALPSHGQETPIRQLYKAILAHRSGEDVPEAKDIYSKVDEVKVRALPVAEVDAILPLAFQCVRSPKADVIEAGYAFLISVMLRFDSAKVMEPYIDALGKLADEKDNPRRQLVLSILEGLLPRPSDKAIAYLEANLENSKNTSQETLGITACLLHISKTGSSHWAPADPSIVHKVLAFVSAHPDVDLTSNVVHQIGLYGIQLPEAVNFISANLDQNDRLLRASAVEAASRLDKDTRVQLEGQLSRIASDPQEEQNVRNEAAEALRP